MLPSLLALRPTCVTSRITSLSIKYNKHFVVKSTPKSVNVCNFSTSHEPKKSTVDSGEISKFSNWSNQWWDVDGPLRTLHHINPTRISYIKTQILQDFDPNDLQPLKGKKILDLGCGAGLLSEPLARLGANVTGVDASKTNIEVAKQHILRDPALAKSHRLEYLHTTAEHLTETGATFDLVCAMEIMEHVSDTESFVESLEKLVKPGGKLIISTVNRTQKSYLYAIVGAEYILGLVAKGTHDWNKFLTPEEVSSLVTRAGMSVEDITGMSYNPLTNSASLDNDTSVNYFLTASKMEE